MSKHVVVVGGGITGLAAAYQASMQSRKDEADVHITVLEQSHRFGGKIRSHVTDDFVIEAGPDSIYTRKSGGLELIRELGLEAEVVYSPPHMKTGILRRGRLFPLPPGMTFGLPTNLRTFALNSLIPWTGKIRGLRDFFLPAKTNDGDESIGALLRRRIGDDLVEILAEPMLAGIHAGSIDRLSVQSVAPYLKKMEQDNGSLIRAMLKQGKQSAQKEKQRDSNGTADAPRGVFVSLTNGLEQLVHTLVARLQSHVTLRTNTAVTRIERMKDGRFELSVRAEEAGSEPQETLKLTADAVILCVPAFAARRLIPSNKSVYDTLTDVPYVSTGAVSLVYPIEANKAQLPFTGFLVPRGEDEMLTACTVVSSKWPQASRSGTVIVRGYIGRDGEQTAMGKSDEVIIEHMKQQMEKYLGLTGEPIWSVVDRWPQAMPQYLVGHQERLNTVNKELSDELPGMYLAGAGYNGMGIPDCITQGRKAMSSCMEWLQEQEVVVDTVQ